MFLVLQAQHKCQTFALQCPHVPVNQVYTLRQRQMTLAGCVQGDTEGTVQDVLVLSRVLSFTYWRHIAAGVVVTAGAIPSNHCERQTLHRRLFTLFYRRVLSYVLFRIKWQIKVFPHSVTFCNLPCHRRARGD
jgi:hypothetical protein